MKKRIFVTMLVFVFLAALFPITALADSPESFTLGTFDPETKTYKDVSGSGTAVYRGISVGFSLTIAGDESITLPPDGNGFTYKSDRSSNYSKIIDLGEGKTASQIADYVRQIRFNGSDAGQNVSILLSDASISYNTFYWSGNGHFYQYVPGTTLWTTAHATAKDMSYNGRSGYLATITSKDEDLFIRTVSNQIGWLGGTRMSVDTDAEGYDATDWKTWAFDTTGNAGYWYWACGPEAMNGPEAAKFYTESLYSTTADTDSSAYYFNWDRGGEPNNDGGECCLATLLMGTGYATRTSGYSWNDLTYHHRSGRRAGHTLSGRRNTEDNQQRRRKHRCRFRR